MSARQYDGQSDPNALLLELHHAHDGIVWAMEGLIRLTSGSLPDQYILNDARWNLSRASTSRRLLWASILHYLSPKVGGFAAHELRRLQETDIELLQASAEHVRNWTAETIFADWPGYCEASQAMRGRMIAAMESEKRILYPMLRDAASPPSRTNLAGVTARSTIPVHH